MTPEERIQARIAQNRAIDEKISHSKKEHPPVRANGEGIRMTPEERAKLGSFIRKVQK